MGFLLNSANVCVRELIEQYPQISWLQIYGHLQLELARQMQHFRLPANWTVRALSNLEEVPIEICNRDIPAIVPGCVHLDLMREKLVPDPYLGCNEPLVQ